jgi:hypothetical protein
MDTRGWQRERTVWTVDLSGRQLPIFTGCIRNETGAWVGVVAIGTPRPDCSDRSAVLTDGTRKQTVANMRRGVLDGRWNLIEPTRDTTGRDVDITATRVGGDSGRQTPVLAIGNGTPAVLTEKVMADLAARMAQAVGDAAQLQRAGVL